MRTTIGFFRALGYPLAGAGFVYREHPGLARLWLPPVVITSALLVLVGYYSIDMRDELAATILTAPVGDGFWASAGRLFYDVFAWLLALASLVLGVLAVALVSGVIAAPFNDALSEQVERLRGARRAKPFRFSDLLADLGRTVALELAKLGAYVLVMLPLFVLSLAVPGVGQIVYTVAGFLFSAAYFCLDYLDWPAARRGWPVRRRARILWRRPAVALGFGAGVWVLLMVPLLNLLFMPAAVAGGTMLFLDLQEEGPGERPSGE